MMFGRGPAGPAYNSPYAYPNANMAYSEWPGYGRGMGRGIGRGRGRGGGMGAGRGRGMGGGRGRGYGWRCFQSYRNPWW